MTLKEAADEGAVAVTRFHVESLGPESFGGVTSIAVSIGQSQGVVFCATGAAVPVFMGVLRSLAETGNVVRGSLPEKLEPAKRSRLWSRKRRSAAAADAELAELRKIAGLDK